MTLQVGHGPSVLHSEPMIPTEIACVDCGGTCHLISHAPPDEPFEAGDVVAYRCEQCNDRWDMELSADDVGADQDKGTGD